MCWWLVCVRACVCVCVCVCVSASPRMPHTLAEILTHAHLQDFKHRDSCAGCGQRARGSSCRVLSEPGPISAASAVASCGWNYWQRRLECCSSSSSLQRGWSARMTTRWLIHRPACSIRHRSPHVSSSANDSFKMFTGARSRRPHHSHFSHGRQNHRSSFCSGRGENLVTISRFGKPLFADMHHHVHAVAGALRKPNVVCPLPDVSAGWPVMWSTLSSHSADASVFTRLSSTEQLVFAFAPISSLKT